MQLMRRSVQGFTLTEMLVALAINGVIFAGLISVFVVNLDHYRDTVGTTVLNEQLFSSMQLMTREIRRAGYWGNASSDLGSGANNNPFMASGTDVTVNSGGDCILFTYDHDQNGSLPSISSSYNDERYGFRLKNGALQSRPPGATFACTAADDNWEDVTDTNILTITALSFTLNTQTVSTGLGTTAIDLRSVDISITGQLVSDTSVTRTLTHRVRIRNDKFIP